MLNLLPAIVRRPLWVSGSAAVIGLSLAVAVCLGQPAPQQPAAQKPVAQEPAGPEEAVFPDVDLPAPAEPADETPQAEPEELPAGQPSLPENPDQPAAADRPSAQPAQPAQPPTDLQLTGPVGSAGREVIQERYPNGRVKIQREVTQDSEQNYINHGSWRMWDEQGKLLAEGQYDHNERHGPWVRWYTGGESELFNLAPFSQFAAPFVSQAQFEHGELNGSWAFVDQQKRKICDWQFQSGRRHGVSVWWYPNGEKMREIHYRDGELDGELIEWNPEGQIVTHVQYQEGRRLERVVKQYANEQKQYEGSILRARLEVKEPDDWWDARLARYAREGNDQKHGVWTAWYPNGQRKMLGQYQFDQPEGKFLWWHENGQKSLEAHYSRGHKEGTWVWWYESGQKSIQGDYVDNLPVGIWTWWNEDGRVTQRVDFTTRATPVASEPAAAVRIAIPSPDRDADAPRPALGFTDRK